MSGLGLWPVEPVRAVPSSHRGKLKAGQFRDLKSLDDFDGQFNPSIKNKQVYDLASGRFIREGRDCLWLEFSGDVLHNSKLALKTAEDVGVSLNRLVNSRLASA